MIQKHGADWSRQAGQHRAMIVSMVRPPKLIDVAYIRDGDRFHTGEALLLACLMHAKGAGRKSKDLEDLRTIMKDQNLDVKKEA